MVFRMGSRRWGTCVTFPELIWQSALSAIVLPAAACLSAPAEEPDPFQAGSSSPALPVGEVVWRAGKTLRFDTPAVRIGSSEFLVCLRPAQAPRAEPEELEYLGRAFPVERLASEPKTGLSLLVSPVATQKRPDLGPESNLSANPRTWPAPGTRLIAVDPRSNQTHPARVAGRDLIYREKRLPSTRLRIHLSPTARIDHALPLIDESRTRLVGFLIPQPLADPGEYHAIPAVAVEKLLRDFGTHRASATGKLGATFELGSTTPKILAVRTDSAADRAGLEKGDVILRIGHWKIERLSDVMESLQSLTPEVSVTIDVLRGLETVKVEVIPAKVK